MLSLTNALDMRLNYLYVVGVFVVLVAFSLSCNKILPKAPDDDQLLDGPIDGLNAEQTKMFLSGDIAFNDEVFTAETGLGPLFVANSCGTCHAGDGKGHPFSTLTRFGQTDSTGNLFMKSGGPQLQHRGIPGFQPEAIPAGASFSRFIPPANTGLGFLDAVSDASLLALADENDADGDGISGRPNWINIPEYCAVRPNTLIKNGRYVGRFGKKAAVYDLFQQTVNAYNQDMGINSSYEHYNTYDGQEADPEVTNQTVQNVVFYLKTLKAPIQRIPNNSDVVSGKEIFTTVQCGKCHVPQLTTGDFPVDALSNKEFFPFSDFLLHDMGPELDDGYTEGNAFTSEWRTPPLWGLGLSKKAQGGQYYLLHDGRASNIEEAITLHGGEATQSRDAFMQLLPDEKANLIKFLESL